MSSALESNHSQLYILGLALAVSSGFFIGMSYIVKKKGLLSVYGGSIPRAGEEAAYLRSPMWWMGMLMMVAGEAQNFVAYIFAPAILVTPLGALSVVVSAVLSNLMLKEQLSLVGKVGALLCLVGSTLIVIHAPKQTELTTAEAVRNHLLSPAFLIYATVLSGVSLWLARYAGPRWGSSNINVYLGICALMGSLSVVMTQALGALIMVSVNTEENQFAQFFTWALVCTVICTLLIEVHFFNRSIAVFNTAVVTPVHYVMFTICTIVSSAVLLQGFDAEPVSMASLVLAFMVIVAGVVILSKDRLEVSSVHSGGDPLPDIEASMLDDVLENVGSLSSLPIALYAKRRCATHTGNLNQVGEKKEKHKSVDNEKRVIVLRSSKSLMSLGL